MAISCLQFIFGQFGKLGYKFLKTADLNQRLSESSIIELCRQGGGLKKEIVQARFLDNENMVAISYLKPTSDEMDRSGIWNHTILIHINDYLQLTEPGKIFAPYFIRELKEPPKNPLEPIIIGEKNE